MVCKPIYCIFNSIYFFFLQWVAVRDWDCKSGARAAVSPHSCGGFSKDKPHLFNGYSLCFILVMGKNLTRVVIDFCWTFPTEMPTESNRNGVGTLIYSVGKHANC